MQRNPPLFLDNSKALTDLQLVLLVRDGVETAFKEVFDRYYEFLVTKAFHIIRDEHRAKDAVQDVYFSLWKNRKRLHEKIQLKPYLVRSVLNRTINHIKSRQLHASGSSLSLESVRYSSLTPLEEIQYNELRQILDEAITQMPDRCRAIYLLCRSEGMSHSEISKELGISKKTIENQMNKALRILKEVLGKYREYAISFLIAFDSAWVQEVFQLLLV